MRGFALDSKNTPLFLFISIFFIFFFFASCVVSPLGNVLKQGVRSDLGYGDVML